MLHRLDFERRREEIEREFEEKVALIRHEVELEKERLREELSASEVPHWRSRASGSSSSSRSGSSSPLVGAIHPEGVQQLGCEQEEWKVGLMERPSSTCESCCSADEPTSSSGVTPCHYRHVLGKESEPDKVNVLATRRASTPIANRYVRMLWATPVIHKLLDCGGDLW